MSAERSVNLIIAATGRIVRDERFAAQAECTETVPQRLGGIAFTWNGKPERYFGTQTIQRAIQMAKRPDLLRESEYFYITDVRPDKQSGADSRSLRMKYGKRAALRNGEKYYLCTYERTS